MESKEDILFWEGFDACLDMVLKTLENTILVSSDASQILGEEILDEASLYKKDG